MIRAAQARSSGETFAPTKTEPYGEPERLTLPRFERLLGWRRTSSLSLFRDGPPPGYLGRSPPTVSVTLGVISGLVW
jgi:hypothetical protein